MASATQINANDGRRPDPTRARGPSEEKIGYLIPAAILLYAILLPQEVRIDLGGVTLFAYRIACIVLLPWIIVRAMRGHFQFHPIDAVILVGGVWMIVSFVANVGLGEGLISGGGLAVDVFAPYAVARVSIRNPTDFRRLLILFAPGIFAAGLIVMIESISGRLIVRPLFQAIFGAREQFLTSYTLDNSVRFGLLRGSGPFSHPILAGLILASTAVLYLSSGLRRWPLFLGLSAFFFALFSVSSAAILTVMLGISLIAYDQISRFLPFTNWPIFVSIAAAIALVIQLASDNGLIRFLISFTLNPQTGHYRRLIWQYGTQSVERYPWFGIGFEGFEREDWMNNSVDAYWLSDAIRHGLIVPIAFLIASIWAITAIGRRSRLARREVDRRLLMGLAISCAVLVLMGFTVAFYGGVLLWYYCLLGAMVSLASTAVPRKNAVPSPGQAVPQMDRE